MLHVVKTGKDVWCVHWVIMIDADDPESAAREALRIQRDPESTATVFDVYRGGHRDNDQGDERVAQIDISEPENSYFDSEV